MTNVPFVPPFFLSVDCLLDFCYFFFWTFRNKGQVSRSRPKQVVTYLRGAAEILSYLLYLYLYLLSSLILFIAFLGVSP
jgi:hypothetical protein